MNGVEAVADQYFLVFFHDTFDNAGAGFQQ